MAAPEAVHKVKHAYELQAGSKKSSGAHWYVVECVCGWSSALHQIPDRANEAYLSHKLSGKA